RDSPVNRLDDWPLNANAAEYVVLDELNLLRSSGPKYRQQFVLRRIVQPVLQAESMRPGPCRIERVAEGSIASGPHVRVRVMQRPIQDRVAVQRTAVVGVPANPTR